MRSCDVFVSGFILYIFAHSNTVRGAALSMGPYLRVPSDSSPALVGANVLKALQASRDEVPHPGDMSIVTKALLSFTGHRSWRAFARSVTAAAAVGLDGDDAVLVPYGLGPRDSFIPIEDRAIRCPALPDHIGRHIETMLGPDGTERL
jgi:hypothetical protein